MESVSEEANFDDIYYGSRRVFFRVVDGDVNQFDSYKWKIGESEQETKRVVDRLKRQIIDGRSVVVPGIPALDFVLKTASEVPGVPDGLPEILRKPLIKCPSNLGTIAGIASGRRSALIKITDGIWYRLKGCGNDSEGFPLRHTTGASDDDSWQDVRGCAFPHTAVSDFFSSIFLIYISPPSQFLDSRTCHDC
jgi:hypothetical protein